MLADGRGVKPVAHLYINQRFEGFPAIFRALLLPDLPDALYVALGKVGGIGFATVGNQLDGSIIAGARHLLVEIHRDDHQPTNAPGLHHLNQLLAIVADGGVNIG